MTINQLAGANDVSAASAWRSSTEATWQMSDGTNVVIRPIEPRDEEKMVRFHRSLSSESVHERYFDVLTLSERTDHNRLAHICHPEPGDIVLVAEIVMARGECEIVGVGRIATLPGRDDGEIALIVSDSFQQRGLGTQRFRRLIRAAKDARLTQLHAHVLTGNVGMLRICKKLGMRIPAFPITGEVKAILDLRENDRNRSEQCA